MPSWVPDDRDALDALARDLAALFADAEQRLVAALSVQVSAGLAQDRDQAAKAINLAELRRLAEHLANGLRGLLPDQIDHLLAVASEAGANAALSELANLADLPDVTTAPVPVGTPAATALTSDLTNAMDDVTRRILRWPDDVYRRAVGQSTSDLLLGMGATQRTVQARAWQQLVADGVHGFTDQANRRWNLATYVEMASRTAARRAWDVQHDDTLLSNNVQLVSIVVGSGACRACSTWAGKVLRIDDGPTGRTEVPSAVSERPVVVDVAGTLAQARVDGWRHPNCRCRQVAYLPGLSVIADVTTYDPDAEAARAKLRDLEVKVRKAKIDAAAAVDEVQRREANAKVRDLQGRIRTHVAEHDLLRQRDREQVNLSQRRLTDGPTAASRPARPSIGR